jgi:hypothetical protein
MKALRQQHTRPRDSRARGDRPRSELVVGVGRKARRSPGRSGAPQTASARAARHVADAPVFCSSPPDAVRSSAEAPRAPRPLSVSLGGHGDGSSVRVHSIHRPCSGRSARVRRRATGMRDSERANGRARSVFLIPFVLDPADTYDSRLEIWWAIYDAFRRTQYTRARLIAVTSRASRLALRPGA